MKIHYQIDDNQQFLTLENHRFQDHDQDEASRTLFSQNFAILVMAANPKIRHVLDQRTLYGKEF